MSKPKVREQGPSSQEIEQFKINTELWQDYQDKAPRAHEMYQKYMTGYVPDGKGGLERSGNVVNRDGSVRIDVGQATGEVANAFNKQQTANYDPNSRRSQVGIEDINARVEAEGSAGADMRLNQQNNYLRSVGNVVAMGKGQQTSALESQNQLVGQAQQKANAKYERDRQKRIGLKQALGTAIAIPTYNYLQNYNKPTTMGQDVAETAAAMGGTPGINPSGGFNYNLPTAQPRFNFLGF